MLIYYNKTEIKSSTNKKIFNKVLKFKNKCGIIMYETNNFDITIVAKGSVAL